jgi:hypothetical protein
MGCGAIASRETLRVGLYRSIRCAASDDAQALSRPARPDGSRYRLDLSVVP